MEDSTSMTAIWSAAENIYIFGGVSCGSPKITHTIGGKPGNLSTENSKRSAAVTTVFLESSEV